MFSPNIYDGGATVLYALRQVIGERAFATLERAWVALGSRRSLTTQDFILLASVIGHRDLRGVPQRLAVRDQDAADAGSPGLGRWTRSEPRRRCARRRPDRCSSAERTRPPSPGGGRITATRTVAEAFG